MAKYIDAPVSQWISVNDRLPEPGQEVLLISHGWSNNHHDIYIGSLTPTPANDGSRGFFGIKTEASDWSLWGWSYLKPPNVTYWMPLPEPPEAEQRRAES